MILVKRFLSVTILLLTFSSFLAAQSADLSQRLVWI